MVKIKVDSQKRSEIMQIAEIFRAKIVDVSQNTLTLEITGQESKVEGFISMLKPFEITKIIRTGIVAVSRG
jgi:acetolactate synthase-1/3 small subunit